MFVLPESLKRCLRPVKKCIRSGELRFNKMGNRCQCYICRKKFHHFYSFRGGSREIPPFVRELGLIGSDVDNFICPHCGCHDRERHLFMYFERLSLWSAVMGGSVLHFAPERSLRDAIVRLKPKEYIQADLFPADKEIRKIDVTAIGFPEEYFDFIICNHVLEHVPRDEQAMGELCRVLKRGKLAVIQVPFSPILLKAFEDDSINTDDLRFRFYGQEDHVRVYGRDLFSRLEGAGFEVMLQKHQIVLPDLDGEFYGVNRREDLILVKRRENGPLK
ncbi:MAG: methyltransferase domain-containing protein [Deltaproteobacteria bacterium]|nr:methyltransferase domain-containing protein [Deltaproteobacteria bacterium]